MTQAFKRDYLQHALAISRWVGATGARCGIDPSTQTLDLHLRGRTVRLTPQFIVEDAQGRLQYVPWMAPRMRGFVGWLPYFNKVWPSAQDKLAFKRHASRVGIRTPSWTLDPEATRGAFIVKARRSTFGRGLRGPFEGASARVTLAEGEYCEQFIVGRLLKALFWNDRLVVVELLDMPTVQGDGERTLRQLVAACVGPGEPWPEGLDPLFETQGLTLDAIVPEGRVVLADYRYVSPLHPASGDDLDVRAALVGTALESQLQEAGRHCWNAVPESFRQGTAFSLDGVIDADGEVGFLEANCNPQLHPGLYRTMLDELFADPARQAKPVRAAEPAVIDEKDQA